MTDQVTPDKIMQIGFGFWPSKVLLTAVKQGLFSLLSGQSLTGKEIQAKLSWHDRGVYDFLDTLVSLGLLNRKGNGENAEYSNADDVDFFLDKNKPSYLGGILEMCDDRLYKFWGDLGEGMKTGKPQNEVKNNGKSMFEELYSSPERLKTFMHAMVGLQSGNFMMLADKFDFSKYKSLCDMGGASAMLSCQIALKHEHVECKTFDLPVVEPIADERIQKMGLGHRVKTVVGDFFDGDFPKADVITMGNILHDWNLEKKKILIKKSFDALPEGGAFIAIENIIDDERRTNTFGLLMSLNMLIEFGDAFDYTHADFDGWAKEAGFKRTEIMPLTGPTSAVIAYK